MIQERIINLIVIYLLLFTKVNTTFLPVATLTTRGLEFQFKLFIQSTKFISKYIQVRYRRSHKNDYKLLYILVTIVLLSTGCWQTERDHFFHHTDSHFNFIQTTFSCTFTCICVYLNSMIHLKISVKKSINYYINYQIISKFCKIPNYLTF